MKMKHILRSALFAATTAGLMTTAGFTLTAQPAHAQSRVTTGTDAQGQPFGKDYYLTMPSSVGVRLVRTGAMSAGDFVLRLEMHDQRSSCAKIGPLKTEIKYDQIYLDVTVASYTVDMRDAPKSPAECAKRAQTPTADILLNREDLKARGIKHIRFNYDVMTDRYDIAFGAHNLRLIKAAQLPVRRNVANAYGASGAYGTGNPLETWFLPENTVVLYAPALPANADAEKEIMAFATENGLQPLVQTMPDFSAPKRHPREYFFIDRKGGFLQQLGTRESMTFGRVRVGRTEYGLHGDVVAYDSYDIHIKKPGVY